MEKKNVVIKNISNHDVGIVVPEIRFSRFISPGRTIKMTKDQLEDALSYPGVPELFNNQYLICEDSEVMEEVGGGYVNVPTSEEEKMTEAEIVNLIRNGTDLQLDKLLKSATPYRLDTIISAAIKCDDLTFSKIKMIEKVTGKDVLQMRRNLELDSAN